MDEDRLPLDPRWGKVAPSVVTCPGRQEDRLKAPIKIGISQGSTEGTGRGGTGLGHRFFPVDIVGDLERCRDCGKYFDIHNLQRGTAG